MSVNNELFSLQADLAEYPGLTEDDLLNRGLILRKALERIWAQGREQGYADAINDASNARIFSKREQDKAAKAAGDG